MLKKLWVKDYRNFDEFVLDLNNRKNCIVFGKNNQGKTNFLESIYFLAKGQAPNENKINNLINFSKKEAFLGLDFQKKDNLNRIYFKINKEGKRIGIYNNKQIRSYSALEKHLQVDYISADIIRIFTESPEFRRKDIDRFCAKFYPSYRNLLKSYERTIKQKNNIIKSTKDKSNIILWNKRIVELAYELVSFRTKALKEINVDLKNLVDKIDKFYSNKLIVHYKHFGLEINKNISYQESLRQKLVNCIDKEIAVGYALYGPHRDDFSISISDKELFSFYSRGINRIIAILFKLAQILKLAEINNTYPILLADDAFVELDEEKKKEIVNLLDQNAQLFYTTVLEKDKMLFSEAQVYKIEEGKIYSG